MNRTLTNVAVALALSLGGVASAQSESALGLPSLQLTGGITVGDGTASAPSYSWVSDTDTGFYRLSANTFVAVTGGSEALRLSATLITATLDLRTGNAADISISGGRSFSTHTADGALNLTSSTMTATTATSTNATINLKQSVTLDADDAVVNVIRADAASLFRVDKEGDVYLAGSARVSGDIVMVSSSGGISNENAEVLINDANGMTVGDGVGTDADGTIKSGNVRLNIPGTGKPTCAVGIRGTLWYTPSAGGAADAMEVCAKSTLDAYAWRSMATVP